MDPSTLTGGALYTDGSCITQLAPGKVPDGQLWFKPAADEFQPAFTYSGASYASFKWSVTDDGAPPGSDTATMTLNVTDRDSNIWEPPIYRLADPMCLLRSVR